MQVPTEDAWVSWSFLQRMDWAALEVSRHGRRVPNWALAFHFARWVLQVLIFLCILWLAPSEGPDVREQVWRTVVRWAIFCHVLESFGWRHGPMCGGRVTPWPFGCFANAHYRLTRGTLVATRNPLLRYLLGDRRTALDVALQSWFLVASFAAVCIPGHGPWSTYAAAAGAIWTWVSDQHQCTDGKGTTYVHFILAGCMPAAQGGVACGQLQLLIVWIASGVCKIGPWMAYVNGPLMSGSVWLRGRDWVWRWLYKGIDDLRPTLLSELLSRGAAHVEWFCPLLLVFTSQPWAIYCSLLALVAMHIYIMANAGLDVHAWNGFFIVAGPCLFGGGASFGFDYVGFAAAPWPLVLWYLLEACAIILGWFYPGRVSFQAGHRNWAGNEPVALILLRRDAAAKLTAAFPIIGLPPWSPVPEELKSWYEAADAPHAAQMNVFKTFGAYWLGFLSLKILPTLVQRALGGYDLNEFHVMIHFQFWDMLCGGYFFCPTHMPDILARVQRGADFRAGQCVCILVNGFPVAGPAFGGAKWRIFDAQLGIIASGEATLEEAQALARLPSSSQRADGLLNANKR